MDVFSMPEVHMSRRPLTVWFFVWIATVAT